MEALFTLMFVCSVVGYLLIRGLSRHLTERNARRLSAEAYRLTRL